MGLGVLVNGVPAAHFGWCPNGPLFGSAEKSKTKTKARALVGHVLHSFFHIYPHCKGIWVIKWDGKDGKCTRWHTSAWVNGYIR